jgi:hypothetical protein
VHRKLYDINRTKLQKLIRRVFDPARLDVEIKDRFGQSIVPREWFLVPFFIIDEVVKKSGTVRFQISDTTRSWLL